MSKSRGNAIELRVTEDETARLIRATKTDSERFITYDPERRPEVANLLLAAALCSGSDPYDLAESIGSGGSTALKSVMAEAVNEHLRPLRERRRALAEDPGYLRSVLAAGNARATRWPSARSGRSGRRWG